MEEADISSAFALVQPERNRGNVICNTSAEILLAEQIRDRIHDCLPYEPITCYWMLIANSLILAHAYLVRLSNTYLPRRP